MSEKTVSTLLQDRTDLYSLLCNLEEQLAESLGRIRRGIDALHSRNDKRTVSEEEEVITA